MQVHHLIGRGKYSQVYAAQHISSGATVALKKVLNTGTITVSLYKYKYTGIPVGTVIVHWNILISYREEQNKHVRKPYRDATVMEGTDLDNFVYTPLWLTE